MATANMTITLPTKGGTESDWADDVIAALGVIDLHDHTTGKGVQIPSAGLAIDADLEMNDNVLTELAGAEFTAVAASGTSSRTNHLFVDSSDSNKVKFRNSAGTLKVWTDANGDLTGVSGDIGADYGTGDEAVEYDSGNDLYKFLSDSAPSDIWSGVSCGDLRIYEKAAVTNYVGLSSPGSLAGSYTLTFPAALPSNNSVMAVGSGGAVTFKETWERQQDLNNFNSASGTPTFDDAGILDLDGASDACFFFLQGLEEGDTLESIKFRADDDTTGTAPSIAIVRIRDGSSTGVTIDSGAFDQAGTVGTYTFGLSGATGYQLGDQFRVNLDVASSSGGQLRIFSAHAVVTR